MKKNLLTLLLLFSTLLYSCKKDAPEFSLNQATLTLNYDEQHQFIIKQDGDNVDAAEFSWTSSDPSVGTISPTGLFLGKKIGKTTIKAEGNGIALSSEITINPYVNLCKEPYLEFGASKATIKSKESRSINTEDELSLFYNPENSKFRGLLYFFESDRLESTMVLLGNTEEILKESLTFFSERYTIEGISEEEILFFSNNTVVIGIAFDSRVGYYAIYLEKSNLTRSALKARVKNRIESLSEYKLQGL